MKTYDYAKPLLKLSWILLKMNKHRYLNLSPVVLRNQIFF
jgi:hypothetical protein